MLANRSLNALLTSDNRAGGVQRMAASRPGGRWADTYTGRSEDRRSPARCHEQSFEHRAAMRQHRLQHGLEDRALHSVGPGEKRAEIRVAVMSLM
jgi:hypothetical protein